MKFSIKTLFLKFSYFEIEKLAKVAKSLVEVSAISSNSENPISETSKC